MNYFFQLYILMYDPRRHIVGVEIINYTGRAEIKIELRTGNEIVNKD